ncbi:MAG: hypothetical protein ABIG88_03760 [Patescibacteria group bacterium]|nr:hypothetical protein [Patescibacteria group bacterium]
MDQNILSGTMVIMFILIIFKTIKYESDLKELKKLIGVPIDKLEDGAVYYQSPQPDGLIFLSKNTGIEPKAYVLDFDIKKLPNSFMFLQDGEKIVPWDPVYLYDTIDDIINLEDLAGKYPV